MAYATTTDVEERMLRELDEIEHRVSSVRLDDAENIIRSRIRDLDLKITNGDIPLSAVIQVEAQAVLRLFRNPDGFLSEGDGNYSYTRSPQDIARGEIEILEDEWRLLGVRTGRWVLHPYVSIPAHQFYESFQGGEGNPDDPA